MDRNKQYPAEVFSWLIILLQMPVLYYGTIPIGDFYRIFQSGKDRIPGRDGAPGVAEIGESEFQELLRGIIAMRSIPGIAGTPGAEAAGLICWIDGDEVGMIVDEVREVVTLSAEDIEEVYRDSKTANSGYVSGIGKMGNDLISLLDMYEVLGVKQPG